MTLINSKTKDNVLSSMMRLLDERRTDIIEANKRDLAAFNRDDRALYDRLVIDESKVDGMIQAIQEVKDQDDPVGKKISQVKLENGLDIINKTDPFGTIMIIYESRPDVTIEAAVLAFKANNKILLKGGKEASHSNRILVDLWHDALKENNLSSDWIVMLEMNREETQAFLR
ncbi:MAG: glutamate-5-semialdehyde dehydrogenase, partial [Cryomorphaceae bacterium]|nr:glutamate-5-semialdehyde dehydrogenase [Cryomorphaceae bacterium]